MLDFEIPQNFTLIHNSLPAKAVLLLLRFLKRRWHEVTEEFFTEGEFHIDTKKN